MNFLIFLGSFGFQSAFSYLVVFFTYRGLLFCILARITYHVSAASGRPTNRDGVNGTKLWFLGLPLWLPSAQRGTQRPTRSNTNTNHRPCLRRGPGGASRHQHGCCLCWTCTSEYLAGRWGAKGATLETITLSPFTPSPFVGFLVSRIARVE